MHGHAGPPSDPAREGRQLATLATLMRHLWPGGRLDLKVRVVVALGFLVAAKMVTVCVPFLYKGAVDALDVAAGAPILIPTGFIIAYGLARMFSQGFAELRDAVFARVGQHAVRSVALGTFLHLHALSLRFHLERRTGGLSRVIERGTKGIDFLLRFSLFNVLPTFFEIAMVSVILVVAYDAWFALVTFVSVVGYISYTFLVTEWRIRLRREMNSSDAEANSRAIDSLLNFETVKYFGNEAHEAARFDHSLARYQRAAVASQTSLAALNVGQGAIIAAGLILVMGMAANGVAEGRMTLGDFVLINTFVIQLYQPLGFLGTVYREIKQSLIDMENMFQLLEVEREVEDAPDAKAIRHSGGEIVFDHVDFSYDGIRPILTDVSFRVPAGHTVAIVGPSGAGKSTISRLLYRFYDVQSGKIAIDGQDIRQVTQASLRDAIGIVPQDTVLFNDSIDYNIRYGRTGASEDERRRAAQLARIDDFVRGLPEGYDTQVGERGLKLSGGEKQRVAIARTILKDPAVLVFDEATSALDTRMEREIQTSLDAVSRDRTTLVVAHRLSTVIDADEILVLVEGRIAERGTHSDLLASDGVYQRMWNRQQRERVQLGEGHEEATADAYIPAGPTLL